MLDTRWKLEFFDAPAVTRSVDRGKRSSLSRIGAFLRRTARGLLRRKGTKANPTARPGEPPRQHQGNLRRLLFFAYDRAAESVVVGPVPFAKGEAPQLLEFGGRVRRRNRRTQRRETHNYRGNPFMGPALETEVGKGTLPAAFKNSVRS